MLTFIITGQGFLNITFYTILYYQISKAHYREQNTD